MKIKEIILEGFKSYAKRTVLKNLDIQFNAITGLNGSGKSNILEAICFALGLSKLKLARAKEYKELIYKNGQAGIKQASVTIVFCNKQKENSPIGLEAHDEVKISRIIKYNSSQYYLNGRKETNTKIKSIFKSIGLNIDNYTSFFVQQGKITSIVNFKPADLMKFLEETAGVNYYNQVKENTLKILEKKQTVIQNCEGILDNEIKPEIERKQEELQKYMKFKSVESKLEQVSRKLDYLKRIQGKEDFIKLEKEINKLENDISNNNKKIKINQKQLNELDLELKNFQSQYNQEEEYVEMKNQEEELQKQVDEIEIKIQEIRSDQELNQKKLDKKKQQNEDQKKNLVKKKIRFGTMKKQIENSENQLNKMELEIKEIKVNSSSKENLQFFENKVKQNKNLIKETNQKIEQLQKAQNKFINRKQEIIKTIENQSNYYDSLQNDLNCKQKDFQNINKKLKEKNDQIQDRKFLDQDIKKTDLKLKELYQQKRQHLGKLYNLFEISYNRNVRINLPKFSIYGKVHNLMQVENIDKFGTAVEAIASGRLFFIIVSDEKVAQNILQNKIVFGKVNLIPNSKIKSRPFDLQKVTQSKNMAHLMGGQIWTPLEVITYPQELKRSFEFVFSNFLICSSKEIASKINFTKAVTLEGDIYDPRGTLQGGYVDKQSSYLNKSEVLKQINNEIQRFKNYLDENYKKIEKNKSVQYDINQLSQQQKHQEKVINNLKNKLQDINIRGLEYELEEIKEKLINLELQIKYSNDQMDKVVQDQNHLQKNLKQKKNKKQQEIYIKNRLEELRNEKKKLLNQIEVSKKEKKEIELFLESVQEENEKSDLDEIKVKKDIERCEDEIQNQIKDKQNQTQKLTELQKILDKKESENYQRLNKTRQFSEQIQNIKEEIEILKKETEQKMVDLTQCKEHAQQLEKNFKGKKKRNHQDVPKFEIEHENIIEEINNLKIQKSELKEEKDLQQKKINNEIEEEQTKYLQKYQIVSEQRKVVKDNRETLKDNISSLDIKKFQTVNYCFEKVNLKLGQIFSALLPGSFAEMHLNDYEDKKKNIKYKGIEIKISFNGKWKESLSELSGGQRSLLALSFLLALLSYHPAPFYIFDEVDAALDLSHTENLGFLIAQHFPQSQFIIISLKEVNQKEVHGLKELI